VPLTLAWIGDGAPRMKVARVDRNGTELTAEGTQLGATYELRYRLASDTLRLELVGERWLELELGGADFFDLRRGRSLSSRVFRGRHPLRR
jgi:hypothetical protein